MKLRSLLVAAALAVPGAALAQNAAKPQTAAAPAGTISYDYVQGSYQVLTDPDVHQWALRGSYRVHANVYLFVEDTSGSRNGGAGFAFPIQQNFHVYGEFGLADSNDGFRPVLEGGARFAVTPEVEVRGAARFITDGAVDDRGQDDDEILFIGEGVFHVNKKVSAVAALAIPVEADGLVLQIGGRFHF